MQDIISGGYVNTLASRGYRNWARYICIHVQLHTKKIVHLIYSKFLHKIECSLAQSASKMVRIGFQTLI